MSVAKRRVSSLFMSEVLALGSACMNSHYSLTSRRWLSTRGRAPDPHLADGRLGGGVPLFSKRVKRGLRTIRVVSYR